MIEQNIEDKVLAKVSDALKAAGIRNVQTFGQLGAYESVKGIENADGDVLVIAKSSPRSYATATIPTCQVEVQLNALVRADVDYNGAGYLAVTGQIMNLLQHWQRCYDDTHEDFTVENEFDCTGFRLDGGNFALDAAGKTWQYSHSMTIFGVVLENQ